MGVFHGQNDVVDLAVVPHFYIPDIEFPYVSVMLPLLRIARNASPQTNTLHPSQLPAPIVRGVGYPAQYLIVRLDEMHPKGV